MEFTQYNCPVCGKRFENGDDVVVCPECGAPHHRECWEQNGRCYYHDRHAEGFSFDKADSGDEKEQQPETVKCQRCGAENSKTAFYCGTCGYPMNAGDRKEEPNAQQNPNGAQGIPFGFGTAGMPMYDPMAGMNNDEEIAPGVKVGEAAKFIGKSTPYYLLVFKRLKQYGSGKFNFSAFVLSGAYFIYRKMYVPGIILMLAMIGATVGSTALAMSNTWISQMEYGELMNAIYSNTLGADKMAVLMISAGLTLLRYGVMVFSGLSANRLYYRHCEKRINRIKEETDGSTLNKELEKQGGVNLPMAISFFASFAVIYELCNMYLVLSL